MGRIKDFYQYTKYVYNLVKRRTITVDAIYENYIIELVGEYGYEALKRFRLIESCGSVNGRNLVTLLDANDTTFEYGIHHEELETLLENDI